MPDPPWDPEHGWRVLDDDGNVARRRTASRTADGRLLRRRRQTEEGEG